MPDLRIAPVAYDAARNAVMRWHYSRVMPNGRLVRYGAWEDDRFIGVVMFGRGAAPNLAGSWDLTQAEVCELVRVALTRHVTPTSAVVAACLRRLRVDNPGLRLVVSFADPAQGHHGGIYQAGNWIYTGTMPAARYFRVNGQVRHPRAVHLAGWRQSLAWLREHVDPRAETVTMPGKHRYLMPLDKQTRRRVSRSAKPYPSRMVPDAVEGSTVDPHPSRG